MFKSIQELRERPCIQRAHQRLDACILELLGDDIRLWFAVHQDRRINDASRCAVRQIDLFGQNICHHFDNVTAALAALFVNARIARDEHANRRDIPFELVYRACECNCLARVRILLSDLNEKTLPMSFR